MRQAASTICFATSFSVTSNPKQSLAKTPSSPRKPRLAGRNPAIIGSWLRSSKELVAEGLREHVTLEVEGIDRMYLNVYVPALQRAGGVASFFRFHLGHRFASSALMDPITKAFILQMEQFAKQEKVPMVTFEKGQRKDDVAAAYRKKFTAPEGVLFIGKAQEKTAVIRTERRRNEQTGATYPWLVRSTAMV